MTEIDSDAWDAEPALNLSSVLCALKHQIPAEIAAFAAFLLSD
ncbi:hypothetical protein [Nonomuraea maritima]